LRDVKSKFEGWLNVLIKNSKKKNKQKDMAFFSFKKKSLVLCMLGWLSANAQIQDSLKPTSSTAGRQCKYPQLQIKGLFQARYLVGMSKDVDVNGLHHTDGSGTDNNFMLKYMRVQVRAQISKRTEVVVLANLADFKNDPKSRVLENAYLKYTFNPN
jgi:hypothetical protein